MDAQSDSDDSKVTLQEHAEPKQETEAAPLFRTAGDYCARKHAELMLSRLHGNRGRTYDVLLMVGPKQLRVPCHRVVLSTYSDFFDTMFHSSLRESRELEVPLDVHAESLLNLVSFVYTGALEVNVDNVEMLLRTASLLQFNTVPEICWNFMCSRMHPTNCIGIAKLADQLNCRAVYKMAIEYTRRHYMTVIFNEEFFNLKFEDLIELIDSEKLVVPSEDDVFYSVMSWVHHETHTRSQLIPTLLSLVRLQFVSPNVISEDIRPLCEAHGCAYLLAAEPTKRTSNPEKLYNTPTKPRKSTMPALLIARTLNYYNSHLSSISIERFCWVKNTWKRFGRVPRCRGSFAAVVWKGDLLLLGGYQDGLTLRTMDSFNLLTKTMKSLSSMRIARKWFDAAFLNGLLYAVGGRNHNEMRLRAVERYNPETNEWSRVACLTIARSDVGVAVLGGRLYAVGGNGNGGATDFDTVECYDPETNEWTFRTRMNMARGSVGVAAKGVFLYAVGGRSNYVATNTVERYDSRIDRWTMLCSLKLPLFDVKCSFLGDRLMALGGYDNKHMKWTCYVHEYDDVEDKWIRRKPLLQREYLCSVVVEQFYIDYKAK